MTFAPLAGKSAGLLRAIAAKIKEELGTPWVPPACRTPRLQRLQGTCLLKPFHAHPLVLPRDSEPVGSAPQLLVESSAQRLVHLAAQWETRRGPLMDQYRHLRAARHSRQLESTRRVSEIQALNERGRSAATEARRKEELCRQLLTELESLPKDVSRAAYTQRILEIIGNIRKQKEEITKILSDTRALQKEINSLTGKLDRTFAVTDELVFKVGGPGGHSPGDAPAGPALAQDRAAQCRRQRELVENLEDQLDGSGSAWGHAAQLAHQSPTSPRPHLGPTLEFIVQQARPPLQHTHAHPLERRAAQLSLHKCFVQCETVKAPCELWTSDLPEEANHRSNPYLELKHLAPPPHPQ
ncbi:coiled-coil domain-containing protein 22 [Chelonoidis abingdonii]|uniref:coiled-coil domain-containing protein 22 n=1 Tax=Chelonoidis abingdonii TaxID=106734 RepID=UPI003F498859